MPKINNDDLAAINTEASDGDAAVIADPIHSLPLDRTDSRLIEHGYEPVAVLGKASIGDNWQARSNSLDAIRAERDQHPEAISTGLRTGRLVGVDIDLHNPEHAEAIGEIVDNLLWSPMRRVGSKGAVLCFRNEAPIAKIIVSGTAPGAKPGDKPERIEILGTGQQFVAYGIHPTTGIPYRWVDFMEPIKTPLSDLPEVTPDQLRELAVAIAAKLVEVRYTEVRCSDRGDPHRRAALAVERRKRDPVSVGELIARLRYISPALDRNGWIGVLGAICSTNLAGVADDDMDVELCEIADAWSRGEYTEGGSEPSNYLGFEDVEGAFDSLDPEKEGGSTFGTIDHLARKAGFTGPRAAPKADWAELTKNVKPVSADDKELRLRLISGADVEPEEITWLWPGHYACGKIHLRAGPPDTGKNVTAIDMAAILSRGSTWPDRSRAPLGDTLIWSGEDSFADTTLPRFLAAGGDRARIHKIRDVLDDDGTRRHFDPATDGPLLCATLRANPHIRYVILDPISVVVGSGRGASHIDAEIRRALTPIVELTEELGIVLEGIIHFRKQSTGSSRATLLERVIGGTAFGAVARIVHAVGKVGDGKSRRLVRIKCNLAEGWDAGAAIGFEYSLESVPVPGFPKLGTMPRVVWGEPLRGDPETLLGNEPKTIGRPDTERTGAKVWLSGYLQEAGASGREVETDLKRAAEAHGHSWITVKRAKKELPIEARQNPGATHGGWCWYWSEEL